MTTVKRPLIIAADPGFDGLKIAIGNKEMRKVYRIPFSVMNITKSKEQYTALGSSQTSIMYEMDENTYLIGERAKEALKTDNVFNAHRADVEGFSQITRFSTVLFKNALEAGIANAIHMFYVDFKKETGEEPFNISNIEQDVYLGVSLPHGYLNDYKDETKEFLAKEHKGTLVVGSERVEVSYKAKAVYTGSQTVNALVGETMNDFGKVTKAPETPSLIIDAGYKTIGIAFVTDAHSFDGRDESNIDFAMNNVNEKVIDEFKRLPIETGTVLSKEIIESGKETYQYFNTETNTVEEFDIKAAKDKILTDIVEKLENKLESNFNHFTNIESIKFTGGTGEVYYKPFVNVLKKKKLEFAEKITSLIDVTFGGEKLDTIFAISVGLYKNIASVTGVIK